MSYDVFDHVVIRCPQLGGPIDFGYCRELNQGLPCRKALDCFQHQFPVEVFFRRILTDEAFSDCFLASPPDRYGRVLAEAGRAKERLGDG